MKSIFLQERKKYKLEELKEKISLEEKDFKLFLNNMLNKSIIKISNEDHIFDYVGLIIFEDYIIKVYPKFYKKQVTNAEFNDIIRVIKKYDQDTKLVHLNNGVKENLSNSILSIMITIIKDAMQYGFYNKSIFMKNIDGNGEIDWLKTVEEINPIIKRKKPYYMDYYTNDLEKDNANFIYQLHIAIVIESIRVLSKLDLLDIWNLNINTDNYFTLDELGSTEHIIYKIEQQKREEYITRNISILDSLYAYMKGIDQSANLDLLYYGTTSFNLVWEKALQGVFSNKLDHTLQELKLSYKQASPNVFTQTKNKATVHSLKLKQFIEKPIWKDVNNINYFPMGLLEPDLITIDDIKGERTFVIMDAKYYAFETNISGDGHELNTIEGQPGVGDVTKQYLYQLAYDGLIDENKLGVKNNLLLPSDNENIIKWGSVSMGLFNELIARSEIKDIDVFLLPGNKIFRNYLKNSKIGIDELYS